MSASSTSSWRPAGENPARVVGSGRARSPLLAGLLVLAALAGAAAAHAQLALTEDPGETLDALGSPVSDTYLTPAARPAPQGFFEPLGGARFGAPTVRVNSPTPFDADFYSVAARDTKNAFFAGAQCRRQDPDEEVHYTKTDTCERIPVIYRFTDTDEEGARIVESYRGDDASDPGGYVGAVAWLNDGRALAVGGDGEHVRRERFEQTTPENDPAGKARAWLYENGAWTEITSSERMLPGMRGLTALGAAGGERDPSVNGGGGQVYDPNLHGQISGEDYAYAGGFRQLFKWQDGAFRKGFYGEGAGQSPDSELQNAQSFRFRVRAIVFQSQRTVPPKPSEYHNTKRYRVPIAMTAGCCAANPIHDYPRTLSSPAPDRWTTASNQTQDEGRGERDDRLSYYWASDLGRLQKFYDGTPADHEDAYFRGPEANLCCASTAAPDGPPPSPDDSERYPEPPSQASGVDTGFSLRPPSASLPKPGGGSRRVKTGTLLATTVRLSAVDYLTPVTAVGSFTRGERKGQAAMLVPRPASSTGGCLAGFFGLVPNPNCSLVQDPDPEYVQERDLRSQLYTLDAYALNALTGIPGSGVGWAVGDHGTVLRKGGQGGLAAGEPRAPDIRPASETRISDRSPYEAFRPKPASEAVGELPALRERPLERFAEPRFVPSAAPDQGEPTTIVMSRDGRRGWGFTKSGTLYRFDGAFWAVCDADGDLEYGIAADPACANAKPKVDNPATAVRVPYENDSDPSNDDRFEVLAGGWRVGVAEDEDWRSDEPRWREGYERYAFTFGAESLAFATPDEAWATAGFEPSNPTSNSVRQVPKIYRFDGTQWSKCTQGSAGATVRPPRYRNSVSAAQALACFDPDYRLPFFTTESNQANSRGVRVTAAGKRVYVYGTRAPENPNGDPDPAGRRTPLAIYRDAAKPCTTDDKSGCWRADAGADTAYTTTATYPEDADQGRVIGLSASKAPDGSHGGWAIVDTPNFARVLYRLTEERNSAGEWQGSFARWPEPSGSPVNDYGLMPDELDRDTVALLSLRQGGEERAVALSAWQRVAGNVRLPLGFDPAQQRWTLFRSPFRGFTWVGTRAATPGGRSPPTEGTASGST